MGVESLLKLFITKTEHYHEKTWIDRAEDKFPREKSFTLNFL